MFEFFFIYDMNIVLLITIQLNKIFILIFKKNTLYYNFSFLINQQTNVSRETFVCWFIKNLIYKLTIIFTCYFIIKTVKGHTNH